jgi:MurNAc alpha-1-phosphate uridylyltransferase
MPDFVFDPQVVQRFVASECLAHVWLVPNPPHNPKGDFGWRPTSDSTNIGELLNAAHGDSPRFTYSTVGLYRRELFEAPWLPIIEGNPQGTAEPLGPLLRQAAQAGLVSASVYAGAWTDVGTPDRLHDLNRNKDTP